MLGETVGEYEILSLVAGGGMGEVYLAQDNELGRQVAVKFVRRGFGTEDFVRHLRHEARILASLNDPHIARLYGGAVTAERAPYFIMAYVDSERPGDYFPRPTPNTTARPSFFRKLFPTV